MSSLLKVIEMTSGSLSLASYYPVEKLYIHIHAVSVSSFSDFYIVYFSALYILACVFLYLMKSALQLKG